MFKQLSIHLPLIVGIAVLLTAPAVHAQRGGFGRGGFGRGGFSGGHVSGHNGPASVRVNVGTFVPPFFRPGAISNNFNPRVRTFAPHFGCRGPFFFGHGFPFGFTVTETAPFGIPQGLGSPIPPIISPVPTGSPFFFGVPFVSTPVFQTVVDLGTIKPIRAVSIDGARTSPVTIVNLPANAFGSTRR